MIQVSTYGVARYGKNRYNKLYGFQELNMLTNLLDNLIKYTNIDKPFINVGLDNINISKYKEIPGIELITQTPSMSIDSQNMFSKKINTNIIYNTYNTKIENKCVPKIIEIK